MKTLILAFVLVTVTACAFDPVAYEEQREREHQDHLKQNGM